MFKKRRYRIADKIFSLVEQPLAVYKSVYKIPDGFWLDPFVLGFFGILIVNAANYHSFESKLSDEEFGFVAEMNFIKLSFVESNQMVEKFDKLMKEQPLVFGEVPMKADFKLGQEYGHVASSLLLGIEDLVVKWRTEDVLDEMDDHDLPEDQEFVKIKILFDLFVVPLVEHFELGEKPDILTVWKKTRNLRF